MVCEIEPDFGPPAGARDEASGMSAHKALVSKHRRLEVLLDARFLQEAPWRCGSSRLARTVSRCAEHLDRAHPHG